MLINSLEILEKMNPNQKINYDRVLQKMIQTWQKEQIQPKILIHSCCAPCSTHTLEYLCQYAQVSVYFANSNIHPRTEYLRREQVQKDFIEAFNANTGNQVGFISAPYKPNDFIHMVKEKHLEEEPEGGERCHACFELRLDLVAEKAQELGFDYFGSALTISPKKNSQLINHIGIEVQEFYQVSYLPSDFKKNNGYKRSIDMCREYDIYRQCYCGCLFAAKEQGVDLKQINQEAKAWLENRQKIPFHMITDSSELAEKPSTD